MEKTCDNCWWVRSNGDNCMPFKAGECVDGHVQPKSTLAYIMWKPKETGIKEIVFDESHVGVRVYSISYGSGVIYSYNNNTAERYPVSVKFDNGVDCDYTASGKLIYTDVQRTLFIGHNAKITVEEDDLPEKLICPVCRVEHDIREDENISGVYYYFDTGDKCPFDGAHYTEKEYALEAMRNLIKAMK